MLLNSYHTHEDGKRDGDSGGDSSDGDSSDGDSDGDSSDDDSGGDSSDGPTLRSHVHW